MTHQPSFSEAGFADKKKITRREKFLARMEAVIPWAKLLAVIEPFYPKGQRGRPPVGLERMLRVYFLQQWYGLADEGVPDATTLLKFRHLLEMHDLCNGLFAAINADVTAAGSRYTPPLAGTRVLNLTTGSVILSGGGLSPDITNAITLNANNSVTVTSGSNNLALTLTVTSGAAKGSFLFPGTGASTPIKGIILREQNVMRGFFLTPTQSGAVLLGQ